MKTRFKFRILGSLRVLHWDVVATLEERESGLLFLPSPRLYTVKDLYLSRLSQPSCVHTQTVTLHLSRWAFWWLRLQAVGGPFMEGGGPRGANHVALGMIWGPAGQGILGVLGTQRENRAGWTHVPGPTIPHF